MAVVATVTKIQDTDICCYVTDWSFLPSSGFQQSENLQSSALVFLDQELISHCYSSCSCCSSSSTYCWADPLRKKPNAPLFQIRWGWYLTGLFFKKIRIDWQIQTSDMMSHFHDMTSFYAVVSEHKASTQCLCNSVCQFLIYSTFVLVTNKHSIPDKWQSNVSKHGKNWHFNIDRHLNIESIKIFSHLSLAAVCFMLLFSLYRNVCKLYNSCSYTDDISLASFANAKQTRHDLLN